MIYHAVADNLLRRQLDTNEEYLLIAKADEVQLYMVGMSGKRCVDLKGRGITKLYIY